MPTMPDGLFAYMRFLRTRAVWVVFYGVSVYILRYFVNMLTKRFGLFVYRVCWFERAE